MAAAQAHKDGAQACVTAEKAASRNQVVLESCEVTTGWGEFVVDISVSVDMRPRLAGAPSTVYAQSRAGIVSDLG